MELIATPKFTVFGQIRHNATGGSGEDGANKKPAFELSAVGKDIPCMRLRELNNANASRFAGFMEKHGFVVLTETGAIREAYLKFMQLLKAFFEGDAEWKGSFKGGVHFNERGVPMWHAGYERCGSVREVFRVPAPAASELSLPRRSWPCPRLRCAWLSVLRLLQRVCHRALTLTLGRPVLGAPPSLARASNKPPPPTVPATPTSLAPAAVARESIDGCPVCCSGLRAGREQQAVSAASAANAASGGDGGGGGGDGAAARVGDEARRKRFVCSESDDSRGDCSGGSGGGGGLANGGEGQEDDAGDDFSVSYALHYPNEFADPALQEEDLTVGEHVDPSLFIAEPCCGVEGLEICDRSSGSWLPVEALCAGLGRNGSPSLAEAEGRELIIFGGKALERATGGRVRGAPHRVRRGSMGRRYCFIYEQKYADFFPPPALD